MYKLRKIKRKDLDLEKYSNTLNDSLNYRIYAEYWYLDVLTDENWECWICGDYEVIMPIPFQLKFGIKFVIQPIFCQQLGVFYKEEISRELFQQFEKKLHKYFVRSYSFNEENTASFQPKGVLSVNQLINLDLPYDTLKKKYNRNRRRKLIKLPENQKFLTSDSIEDFIDLFKSEYPNLARKDWVEKLKRIMSISFQKKIGYQFRIESNEKLLASLFYIKASNRVFQLGAARNKKIPDIGFFTIIIDFVIHKFSDTPNYKFDFEGSNIKGVASFNESFGAQKSYYTVYSNFRF